MSRNVYLGGISHKTRGNGHEKVEVRDLGIPHDRLVAPGALGKVKVPKSKDKMIQLTHLDITQRAENQRVARKISILSENHIGFAEN